MLSRQSKTAALIAQSRRWMYGRVKGLLYDGFFSFAVVRQFSFYYNSLIVSVMQMQCSIIGTLAEESQIRKKDWITNGSNIFFQKKDNQCRPLSFWTTQDIWNYIKLYKLPVSDLYNQGYQRNGCMYCGFGLCSERRKFGINRFERLAQTHPKQYEYMISRWASLFTECGIPY